nr:MAG TPA: hypothetical protein [Caudoviricetes sp.]
MGSVITSSVVAFTHCSTVGKRIWIFRSGHK